MSHARRTARSDGGLDRHRKNPDGATTVVVRANSLRFVSTEKTLIYQLAV